MEPSNLNQTQESQPFQPRSARSILGEAAKKAAVVTACAATGGAIALVAAVAITAATGGTGAEVGACAAVGGITLIVITPAVFAVSLLFFAIMLKARDQTAPQILVTHLKKIEEETKQTKLPLFEETNQQQPDNSLNETSLWLMANGCLVVPATGVKTN